MLRSWSPVSLFLLGAIFFTLLPASLQAQDLPVGDLVQKIQEAYEKTADFKSKFTQETTIKSLKKTEKEEGTVYFKKPRMMRWVYSKPKSKELVIGQKKSWLYIPEDHVAYLQDTESLLKSRVTMKFLSGIGKLAEDFEVRYADGEPQARGPYRLELKPKAYVEGLQKLSLTVSRENFQITSVLLTDLYGNLTKTTFSGTEFNTNLTDGLFTFKPPKGVDVFDLDKKK